MCCFTVTTRLHLLEISRRPNLGFAEFLGRMLYHLQWEVRLLDRIEVTAVNSRAASIESFPGVLPSHLGRGRTLTYLAAKGKFTASEIMSISSRIVYVLLDRVREEHQETWLLHVEISAGLQSEEWTPAQRYYRKQIVRLFLVLIKQVYGVHRWDHSP